MTAFHWFILGVLVGGGFVFWGMTKEQKRREYERWLAEHPEAD